MSEALDTNLPFKRGQTYYGLKSGDTAPSTPNNMILGQEFQERDQTYGTGRMVTLRVVKNSSGVALTPKSVVRLKPATDGTLGTEVDGLTTGPTAKGYVVDEFLPSGGVQANDLFFIVVGGPAKALVPESEYLAISVGDALIANTGAASTGGTLAGKVAKAYAATETTSQALTLQLEFLKKQLGTAASAKSSRATTAGQDCLVIVGRQL